MKEIFPKLILLCAKKAELGCSIMQFHYSNGRFELSLVADADWIDHLTVYITQAFFVIPKFIFYRFFYFILPLYYYTLYYLYIYTLKVDF